MRGRAGRYSPGASSALTQIVPYSSSFYTVFHSVIYNSVLLLQFIINQPTLLCISICLLCYKNPPYSVSPMAVNDISTKPYFVSPTAVLYSANTPYSVSLTAVYALQYQPMHPTLYLLLHTVHIVSFIILSLKSAHFIRNNVRFKVIVHLLNYIMRRPKIIPVLNIFGGKMLGRRWQLFFLI